MKDTERFVDAGNVKFKSAFRDSMYFVIRQKDETGLLGGLPELFYAAFAIGYHFNKQETIAKKSINHVNLVSLERSVKEMMVLLVLKRKPNITEPKDLWREVETYAEYGIQVLFNAWKKNNVLEINEILEEK